MLASARVWAALLGVGTVRGSLYGWALCVAALVGVGVALGFIRRPLPVASITVAAAGDSVGRGVAEGGIGTAAAACRARATRRCMSTLAAAAAAAAAAPCNGKVRVRDNKVGVKVRDDKLPYTDKHAKIDACMIL